MRSGKFYYRNEKKTLSSLGLTPAPGSGSGWIVKEDGENDTTIVQLKSTDSSSYSINLLDIKKLEYHASVSNKVPVFLIQFLKTNKIYAVIDVNDIEDLQDALKNPHEEKKAIRISSTEDVKKRVVKSSSKSRDKFYEERSKDFGKRR